MNARPRHGFGLVPSAYRALGVADREVAGRCSGVATGVVALVHSFAVLFRVFLFRFLSSRFCLLSHRGHVYIVAVAQSVLVQARGVVAFASTTTSPLRRKRIAPQSQRESSAATLESGNLEMCPRVTVH